MALDAVSNGVGGVGVNIPTPKSVKPKEAVVAEASTDPVVTSAQASVVANVNVTAKSVDVKNPENKDETKKVTSKDEESGFAKQLQEEQKTKEERKKEEADKARADEQKREELKQLTEQLNAKMNQFGSSIRFGINDKENSIAVSVLDGASEKNVKSISPQDASKLVDRMSFVLGVLFDQKG